MKWFMFFFLASGLFASVNEPLRCEISSGYRNDRIHWHLQDPGEGGELTYSELYRDVQYWENGLLLKTIHRDLIFFLRGTYGTFGRGALFQRYPDLSSDFHFNTEGWTADGVGYFGYAVNLTDGRTYKVILVPLIGYSAYFEQLKRKNGTPPSIDSFASSLPGTFRLVWNGFFLGAGFTIEPGGRLILNAGYSYHFMHNRVHTSIDNSSAYQSIRTSSGGNKGHTGWAQIDGVLNRLWRIGIGGQIHYFTTRVIDATIRQTGRGNFSEKFKLRWTVICGWAQISREF